MTIDNSRANVRIVPPELKKALSKNKKTTSKFSEFGKGKQRDFAEYISDAKLKPNSL